MPHNKGGHPGESNPNAKLTASAVRDIRAQLSRGVSRRQIADSYGVTTYCIKQIHYGKSWRHVK